MSHDLLLTESVSRAVGDLEHAFPDRVSLEADGSGGAVITVGGFALGARWAPATADLAFHVPFNYPWAAIYPYYLISGSWSNVPASPALQRVNWRGRDVVQISLRHNGWTPQIDTALGCVRQVIRWLRQVP
jgi:hypothetical protein